MRTRQSDLLAHLASGVLPVDPPSGSVRARPFDFESMLGRARSGELRSGLPVRNAQGASFSGEELEIFAPIADAAEAAGVRNVAIAFGRRLAIVSIEHRQAQEVPAMRDSSITPGDIITSIDGLVQVEMPTSHADAPAEPEQSGHTAARGRVASVLGLHPAVAELLAGATARRDS